MWQFVFLNEEDKRNNNGSTVIIAFQFLTIKEKTPKNGWEYNIQKYVGEKLKMIRFNETDIIYVQKGI